MYTRKKKKTLSKRQGALYRRGVLGVGGLEQIRPPGTGQARPQVTPDAGGPRIEGQGAGVVAGGGEVVTEVGRGDPVFRLKKKLRVESASFFFRRSRKEKRGFQKKNLPHIGPRADVVRLRVQGLAVSGCGLVGPSGIGQGRPELVPVFFSEGGGGSGFLKKDGKKRMSAFGQRFSKGKRRREIAASSSHTPLPLPLYP